jgi:DNA-binding GntR family transcriptional regulator
MGFRGAMQKDSAAAVPMVQAPGETLADRAHRLIEDAIVRLDLEPGARVTEQDLASRFGLGRTPVREAVQRLVADGLLIVYPRKGMAVAPINPLEVLLALDARAALERVVAAGAARRARAEQRESLAGIGAAIRRAAEAGDAASYMQSDHAFDAAMGAASGNPFAVRALAPLQTMSRRAWFYFSREADLAAAARRHAALIEAVTAGDPAAAERASDDLVAHVRAGLKEALASL